MNKAKISLRSAMYALTNSLSFLEQKEKSSRGEAQASVQSSCIAALDENDYNIGICANIEI